MLARLLEGKTRDELLELARRYQWWHAIDLRGLVTSGVRSPLPDWAFSQIDFKGKKVLDIGCWDGLWSFEAEKRGAREVYATDYVSLRSWSEQPTFQLAHKLLESKAKYYPNVSVYDIKSLGVTDFDVVVYCGIYYHLRDPLRALSALREVMVEGGLIVVEGPVIDASPDVYARFFGREWFSQDPTNWWVPTVPCLREWLDCSFFDILAELSTRRDLSPQVPPPAPAALPPRVASPLKTALQRISGLFAEPAAAAPARAAPAEAFDRYVVLARATSASERLIRLLNGRALPRLADTPGLPQERIAGFCSAATAFHAARPWKVREDVTIKVESAFQGGQPMFVMVLAEGRGFVIYYDRGWLTMTLQGSLPGERIVWAPFLAVLFVGEDALPAGEAAALRASGWTAADEVHPLAVLNDARAERTPELGRTLRRPDPAQMQLLEAACRALPAFIDRHDTAEEAVEDVTVPVSGGEFRMTLSWMTERGREL